MRANEKTTVYYVCILEIFACVVFFSTFFAFRPPITRVATKSDLPSTANGLKFEVERLYRRRYEKIIIVIIDALRYDFIADGDRMPNLLKALKNHSGSCLIAAKTDVPTVTLPRIKSIVTGDESEFLDLILNFGAAQLAQDNIILQANNHGFNIVFYGDDTWLRLFPDTFKRFEGTTSFFVNDFYEVDENVTRNLMDEFLRSDWDVMILHYLGLDHIGHVEGPKGRSIAGKLKEMDDVFQKIFEYVEKMDEDALILLTGDHGMKDSGGHGGSSLEEVTVPVVIINGGCDLDSNNMKIRQVDLAPLLAILLGVPIPAGSIGSVNPKLLDKILRPEELLYALYYNTVRMRANLFPADDPKLDELMSKAVKSYASALTSRSESELSERYFLLIQDIITARISGINEMDVSNLIMAIILFFQAMVLLFRKPDMPLILKAIDTIGSRWICLCTYIGIAVVFAAGYLRWPYISGVTLIIFNCYLIAFGGLDIMRILSSFNRVFWILLIFHPLTFLSTSFIEEEHLFWYTAFATLNVFLALRQSIRSVQDIILVMVVHRFLQTLNQTGNKWADCPDLGGWLRSPENHFIMTSYYFAGIVFCFMVNWFSAIPKKFTMISVFCTIIQGCSIFLYYVAVTKDCQVFFPYPKTSGSREVMVFWIVTAFKTSFDLSYLTMSRKKVTQTPCSTSLTGVLVQLLLSVLSLLMKPQNIILPPAMVCVSWLLCSLVTDMKMLGVLHYSVGMVYYFLSGNSNSIASIDVTAGFKGVDNCNLFFAGLLITLHTYAFPILAFLLMLKHLLLHNETYSSRTTSIFNDFIKPHLLLNASPTLVFMIISLIQREHLFIWSVFSPKLLYVMCQSLIAVILAVMSTAAI